MLSTEAEGRRASWVTSPLPRFAWFVTSYEKKNLLVDFLLNFGLFFGKVSGYKNWSISFSCRYSSKSRQYPSSNILIDGLLPMQPRFQINIQSINHVSKSIYNQSTTFLSQYTIDQSRFQIIIQSINHVSQSIYNRSTSFLSQCTIDCSHFPNLVNASWLWRFSRGLWANQKRWNILNE